MVDVIMVRTFEHEKLLRLAEHSVVPVINGLTDFIHPCQLLADMQTWQEHRGTIAGRRAAWIGDGNNMCNSYINAARQFDFELRIGCPPGYAPDSGLLAAAGDRVSIVHDPRAAVDGADLVVTDVWASMGQEEEALVRQQVFQPYQVDVPLLDRANPNAILLHCLPAHRGEEITPEAMEDPRSRIFDQAENRMHAQNALLVRLLAEGWS
jgi:ornithine carbamoyltransferase